MKSPNACSLTAPDLEQRLREWQSLRADALISEDPTPERTVTVFERSDEVLARLVALIEAEKGCCSFLHFDVAQEGDRIRVEVTAPGMAA